MIKNKTYKGIIIFSLIILILMGQTEVFSKTNNENKFSDEKKVFLKNSRILIGYDATIIDNSDLIFKCWVILEDKGENDVVWESVSINCTFNNDWKYKENTTSIKLIKNMKTEKKVTILTPYEDLTKENVKDELKIIFSFYEDWDDKEITPFTFGKSENASYAGLGLITLILTILSIFRQKKRIKPQRNKSIYSK